MNEMNCDILVIGGGGSGLVAAVRAAEVSGKSVIILEKTKMIGGGMLFACSMRTFRSNWQAERGIPDRTAEYIRAMMDHTYWRLDHGLVRDAILGTGEFFDWYFDQETEENQAKYEPQAYVFDVGDADAQIGPQYSHFRNGSGALIVKAMKRACDRLGIPILTQHRATDVELTEGKVSAIYADGENGPVKIHCGQVILSCSSWIRNKEVVKKVLPEFISADVGPSPHENPAYTGDGIPIAEKAGAKIDYDSFCLRVMGPICGAAKNVLTNFGLVDKVNFDSLTKDGCMVMVDLNGRRFAAETTMPRMDMFDSGHILLKHPKCKVYFIYSADTMRAIIQHSQEPPRKDIPDFMTMPKLPPLEEINKWFEAANAQEWSEAAMANSIPTLARRIGIEPDALADTICEYNRFCKAGEDTLCFKRPEDMIALENGPFYAISGKLATDGAFGGVEVDRNMRAYRADRTVVDNFYVTGDFASGRHIVMGGIKHQVLNDMSWALASGFIAGTRAGEAAG